jgi:hypothetical protein
MSRRIGLRLTPHREDDDVADGSGRAGPLRDEGLDQQPSESRTGADDEPRDQPPALGATPAVTPSR